MSTWIDRDEALARAQTAHDNQSPPERPAPSGRTSVWIHIDLDVEVDEGRVIKILDPVTDREVGSAYALLTPYGREIERKACAKLETEDV
jgi:hypothetical protein